MGESVGTYQIPPGQANVRVSVHKYLEVHQLQEARMTECQYPLKYHYISTIHCVLGVGNTSVHTLQDIVQQLTVYLALA